ncbi:hypothetical protein HY572_01315 [Candidatus Micrarchaeota archaeon]|nr:hypothetical protein [Candidatus Micrarchaeota archaeon]
MSKNADVARLLQQVADALLALGEDAFKVRAYKTASQTIEVLDENIQDVHRRNALEEIPGVGKAISEKIAQYLDTGKLSYYEGLKKKLPKDFEQLIQVESLGPKKVYAVYKKLNVNTLKDLENACLTGKVRKLSGFGEKSQAKILENLGRIHSKQRVPYETAHAVAQKIVSKLEKQREVKRVSKAGSLRRKKKTIGDVDILVVSANPKKTVDFLVRLPWVKHVIGKGPKKTSFQVKNGLQVDVRLVNEDQWGAALVYFTGSKAHNIELRRIAQGQGLKLNEYGLFSGKKCVASKTEEDLYHALGLKFVPPERRETRQFIESKT